MSAGSGQRTRRAQAMSTRTSKAGAYADGLLDGVEKERARIVDWLRSWSAGRNNVIGAQALNIAASEIERGVKRP